MITNTEDKFDVDYDIFSFAGRTAMIAGGIYAIDKSLRDDVFKKSPKNFTRLNNEYTNKLAKVISVDNVDPEVPKEKNFSFNNKPFFENISEKNITYRLNSAFDQIQRNGKIIDLKVDLKGGYKGMSSDLFDKLDELSRTIKQIDESDAFKNLRETRRGNFQSGTIHANYDKNGKLISVGVDSLLGRQNFDIIDENGFMTIDGNRYIARPQFKADGLKASKPFGLDVGQMDFTIKNYADMLSDKISKDEIRSMKNSALVYVGKNYEDSSKIRINEKVAQNILNSAKADVFSKLGRTAKRAILKDAEVNGLGVANATSLNRAIIRQAGDAISEVDGLRYTSNAYQIFRANTFAIGRDGKAKTGILRENFAFLNDEQLASLKEVLAYQGVSDFGDLAKEELIANKNFFEVVGDNSRAVGFRNDSIGEAGEFLLNKALTITGLSKQDFQKQIQKAGFDAFEEPIKKQLQEIGINDYSRYLEQEMNKSIAKRNALTSKKKSYLKANNYVAGSTSIRAERRDLIAKLEMYRRVNNRKSVPAYFDNTSKGTRDSENLKRAMLLSRRKNTDPLSLSGEIKRIETRLEEIRKMGFTPKIIRNTDFQEGMQLSNRGHSLKKQVQLIDNQIEELDEVINSLFEKQKTSNVLGLSKDKKELELIKKNFKDLTIDSMYISNDGMITFDLLRKYGMEQGVKIVDPSGEAKGIVKASVGDLGSAVFRNTLKLMGLNWKGTIKEITESAILSGKISKEEINKIYNLSESVYAVAKSEAMKTDITDRNVYDILDSIKEKNKLDSNSNVTKLLNDFENSGKTDQDFEKLFRSLNTTMGGDFQKIIGTSTTGGFIKSKIFSVGAIAEELGAGGPGFVSGRHIKLMTSLGLENFASSLVERKINNKGAVRTYMNLQKTQKMLMDSVKAGSVKIKDFSDIDFYRFMEEVYPGAVEDTTTSAMGRRTAALSKYGKVENGAFFFDLGQEIEGINKIPIFTDLNLEGFVGEQIGFDGDYKKYTEIDNLTKEILRESRTATKDTSKLKSLIINYKTAMSQLDKAVHDKMLKFKVSKSMLGQAASGSRALNEYAEKLFGPNTGIKHSAPYVAAVSKKQFKSMFGPEAYKTFMENQKKGKVSDFWAFMTREPVEGLSGLPVNVVVADAFEGITDLTDKRIALVANKQNSLLNMVFGDYDGDQLSLVAATNKESTEELRKLATSNDALSISYRFAQEAKTKIKLKEQLSKSILHNDLASLRLSGFHAKELEKTFVGIASKSLESLHTVNQKINSGTAKFAKVESLLHVFAENVIKAKAQSADDLINRKSQTILDALVGGQEFKNASMGDRIKQFRGFVDHITLGEAGDFGDRIRTEKSSGKISQELRDDVIKKLGGDNKAVKRAAEILDEEWFMLLTSNESMSDLMEVSGLSSRGAENTSDAIQNIIDSELGESRLRITKKIEETQQALKDAKKGMQGLGGNIAKYALLPAALFGVAGTVFGARSSIQSEVEFSDNKNQHNKSGLSIFKPRESINFDRPRHIKPQITGSGTSSFQINKYAASHQVSEMRVVDDTMNFDYFDMKDKMRRGY